MQHFTLDLQAFTFNGQAYPETQFSLWAAMPPGPFPDASVPVGVDGGGYFGFPVNEISLCPQDHTGYFAVCTLFPESNYSPEPVGTVVGLWSPELHSGSDATVSGVFSLAISNSYQPGNYYENSTGTYAWASVPGSISQSTQAVPEPDAFAFLALGALVVIWKGWRH